MCEGNGVLNSVGYLCIMISPGLNLNLLVIVLSISYYFEAIENLLLHVLIF